MTIKIEQISIIPELFEVNQVVAFTDSETLKFCIKQVLDNAGISLVDLVGLIETILVARYNKFEGRSGRLWIESGDYDILNMTLDNGHALRVRI